MFSCFFCYWFFLGQQLFHALLFYEYLFAKLYMIIRNRSTKTLKASTLGNRGCCASPEGEGSSHDPDGVAAAGAEGAPFQGASLYSR